MIMKLFLSKSGSLASKWFGTAVLLSIGTLLMWTFYRSCLHSSLNLRMSKHQ